MAGLLVHEPGCNPSCHGCRHRQRSAPESLAAKRNYLARTLSPWAAVLDDVHGVPEPRRLHYRDRVTLSVRRENSVARFGLIRRDELIPIPDCPVHSARVNALVDLLARRLPPHEDFPLGWLHVSGAQATLVVRRHDPPTAWIAGLGSGLQRIGVEGLWLNCNPSAGRKLFLKTGWQLAWGDARSRDAEGLLYGPASFQQLLPELHGVSLDVAAEYLAVTPASSVLDLYCGNGRTLRRWRSAGARVLGVDSSGEAIACGRENAPGATLLQGACATRLPQIREWWAESRRDKPVTWVNPDRGGLEAAVSAALCGELRPGRLAYLSCSAGSLHRDLAQLCSAGYEVERLLPFDFFPQTHHVEVLALLRLPSG